MSPRYHMLSPTCLCAVFTDARDWPLHVTAATPPRLRLALAHDVRAREVNIIDRFVHRLAYCGIGWRDKLTVVVCKAQWWYYTCMCCSVAVRKMDKKEKEVFACARRSWSCDRKGGSVFTCWRGYGRWRRFRDVYTGRTCLLRYSMRPCGSPGSLLKRVCCPRFAMLDDSTLALEAGCAMNRDCVVFKHELVSREYWRAYSSYLVIQSCHVETLSGTSQI